MKNNPLWILVEILAITFLIVISAELFRGHEEVREAANLADFEVLASEHILYGTISVVRRRATGEEFILYYVSGHCSASIAPARSSQEQGQ